MVSVYHNNITDKLLEGCKQELLKQGVKAKNILIAESPGAYEMPLTAQWLKVHKKCDAIICLGCVIKGDTDHDVYINHAVADGLMQLNIQYKVPFVFGLLTTNTLQQAKDRAGGKAGNKGTECAQAALQMLSTLQKLKK